MHVKITVFQKGFNYSQDGQGNRLVFHLQGCNMHCPWCANPEGIPTVPPIMVNKDKLLDTACPCGAVRNGELDRSFCEACKDRKCLDSQANLGLSTAGSDWDTDEMVKEAIKCKPMYFDSGGVTFTGGEPTMQFDALMDVYKKLKENGIHTAIETNGTSIRLKELLPFIDQLIIDLKHHDSEKQRAVTGVGNETTKANIEYALKEGKPVLVRIPLVNGFNADKADAEHFADYFESINAPNLSVELLSYHEFGKDKWQKCGMEYTVKDGRLKPGTVKMFEDIFKERGINTIRT
jgi:pyruvate formate lyase activating enzyme